MAIFLRPSDNELGTWWLPISVTKVTEEDHHSKSSNSCTSLSWLCKKICKKSWLEKFTPKIPLSRMDYQENLKRVYVDQNKISRYTIEPVLMPNQTAPEDVRCRAETASGTLLGYVGDDSLEAMTAIARNAITQRIQASLIHYRALKKSRVSAT